MKMATEFSELYRRYLAALVLFHLVAADEVGLSGTDYQANNILEIDGPMTSGELAQRLGLSTGATTRLIDRLVETGYARRIDDARDRRRVLVEHTGHMPAELDVLLAEVRVPIGEVLGSLTAEQREGVVRYFEGSTAAYRAATAGIRSS
nr:MarR family [uncultured bacterium]